MQLLHERLSAQDNLSTDDTPPGHDPLPVTVVIAAKDEADNIVDCIESVRWASEVLVAEHGSSDNTAELAREAGATVIQIQSAGITVGGQRNAAIEIAENSWILVIDADERSTPELRDSVKEILCFPEGGGAYRVRRQNIFLGRKIHYSGWQHDRPIRLFRSEFRYNDSLVHEHVEYHGPVGQLPGPLVHYPYKSLDQYFTKLRLYSQWWAEQEYARGRRVGAFTLITRPLARFFRMYILQLGILDGMHGLVLASLASASVLAKYARLWGMQLSG